MWRKVSNVINTKPKFSFYLYPNYYALVYISCVNFFNSEYPFKPELNKISYILGSQEKRVPNPFKSLREKDESGYSSTKYNTEKSAYNSKCNTDTSKPHWDRLIDYGREVKGMIDQKFLQK